MNDCDCAQLCFVRNQLLFGYEIDLSFRGQQVQSSHMWHDQLLQTLHNNVSVLLVLILYNLITAKVCYMRIGISIADGVMDGVCLLQHGRIYKV